MVGRHFLGVDAVLPDNKGAAGLVARHLVELGHRDGRGDLWTGPADHRRGPAGRGGQGAARRGARAMVVETDFTGHDAGEAAIGALDAHPEATAVLALSDAMAISVLTGFRRAGVDVPAVSR